MGCSAWAPQSSQQHARSFIAISYYYCNCCYCYYSCYLLLRTPAKTHKPFFLPSKIPAPLLLALNPWARIWASHSPVGGNVGVFTGA